MSRRFLFGSGRVLDPPRAPSQGDFASEAGILMNERVPLFRRCPFGSRQSREAATVSRGDRQYVRENPVLIEVGKICNEPAIATQRLEIEDICTGLNVWNEGVFIRAKVCGRDVKAEPPKTGPDTRREHSVHCRGLRCA